MIVAIQEHLCSYSYLVFFLGRPIGRVLLIPRHVVGLFRPLLPSFALTAGRSLFSFVLFSPIGPVLAPDVSGGFLLREVPGDTAFCGRSMGRTSRFCLGAILGRRGLRNTSCGSFRIGRPLVSIYGMYRPTFLRLPAFFVCARSCS